MQQKHLGVLALVLLIVFVCMVGVLVLSTKKALAPTNTPGSSVQSQTSTTTVATSSISLGNGMSITTTGGSGTIKVISSSQSGSLPPPPSLTGAIVITNPQFTPEITAKVTKDEQDLIASLKQNPANPFNLLQLGIYREDAGDYAGAEAAWTYVAAIAPTSYIAFYNLGDLYMNYLANNANAVTNFRQVISLKPDYIDAYTSLATIYRYRQNDPTAAAAVLALGLKNNPANPQLLAAQKQ